ncbi:type I-E CRISPR-associated protein Cas6/Cse3/CasE [Streptomyces sp. NBC_00341]|uniref:type I-E CRISPR-associated protein Cas6/Cse3/CasE n=1 Tax=Streptomyces sp. NBC_00341 TaxID=2975717 RepID=UPI00308FECFA|nr:type I-E CRISPR-associated protein Cas6/Cse3/CasE [Streptomyces sp. NBC_00341]
MRPKGPGSVCYRSTTLPTAWKEYGDLACASRRGIPKLSLTAKHQGARIGRAELKGELTVTDPGAFVDALANGVGRARS